MSNKFLLIFIWTILCQACTVHSQDHFKNEKKAKIEISNNIPFNSVPVKFENGRIIISVKLNDHIPTQLILDNCASKLLLDKTFVSKNNNQLKLSTNPIVIAVIPTPMGDITGKISINKLKIEAGSKIITTQGFTYICDMISWFYKDNISGIFPMGWLGQDHIIYIDPINKYISFKDSLNSGYYEKIPFTLIGCGAFFIKSTLNIKSKDASFNITGNFLIDYGYPRDEIVINQAKINGTKYNAEEGFEISAKGKIPEKIQNIYADTARLLNFDKTYFKNLRISIERPVKGSAYEPYAGVIGSRILENYIIAIDYKNKFLYVKKTQKEIEIKENELYKKWGISLIVVPKTKGATTSKFNWFVSYIKKNKKADAMNIKLWDELQMIDNVPAEKYSLINGQNALKNAKKLIFKGDDKRFKILEE